MLDRSANDGINKNRDSSVVLVRRSSFLWPKDADNGLSFSKMVYVTDLRHPRYLNKKGER